MAGDTEIRVVGVEPIEPQPNHFRHAPPAYQRGRSSTAIATRSRAEVLENAARQSLAKHLTVGELRLFVDFIKQPEALSAMGKMKYYMADLMPVLQQEMMPAVKAPAPAGTQ